MKTKLRIASVLLVLCMLASCLASCETKEKDVDISKTVSSETSENVWVDPAPEMYKAAVEKIKSQKDFALDVEYTYSRIADLDENIEIGSIHVDNLAYGADGMASKSVKRVRYNDNDETTITETFANGKAYLDFEEESFVSEMTAEQYSERVFPSVLFDAALYSEIKTSDEKGKNGETVIIFSGAESVEKWAGADYSKLVSFSGKANIDSNGNLVSSSCEMKFTQGMAEMTKSVSVDITRFTKGSEPIIEAPENADEYEDIESIEAPLLLERANDEIVNAVVFKQRVTEAAVSQAMGVYGVNALEFDYFDYDGILDFKREYYSQSQAGEYDLSEKYVGGEYFCDVNGKEYESELTDEDVDDMRTQVKESLNSYLPEISHIEDASVEYLNGYIYITMKGNSAFDDLVRKGLCEQWVGDGGFLDDRTDSHYAETLGFTITLDADSLLPVNRTIDYKGFHTLKGNKYELSYEANIACLIANRNIYYSIAEEHHPSFETEPDTEEKAKPAFYKVTGTNGETMWLLGTIHVGDNRTAYLPKEIYTALDSSDAVAFEVNVPAVLDDDSLMKKREKNSKYSGNDTIKNHIDPELFDSANKLMTAFGIVVQGDYFKKDMLEYKPYVWESHITNMYDSHGVILSSDKGVDMRLILRAEENKQKIYDIEDREESILREGSYSDVIQGYLLDEAINGSRGEYINNTNVLYDAWCKGDLETIKALLYDESDYNAASDEEKKAYDEYEKIIQTDRDAVMLNKAVEYLNSGETVFFAVGLAHLIDPDSGLLKTLAESGYTVELVTYA